MSTNSLSIGLVVPDVLGTYGDDGNAVVLARRATMRGIDAEIVRITLGNPVPDSCDLYCIGGGEDSAQVLAAQHLRRSDGLQRAADRGTPIVAICAGLQVLGTTFHAADGIHEGLGLIDATTAQLKKRAIGEIATELAPEIRVEVEVTAASISGAHTTRLTGFENHMGATILGREARPLGRVLRGVGNNDEDGMTLQDGVVQGSIIATYMHGPFLARNPHMADLLLARALGVPYVEMAPLVMDEVVKLRRERMS